MRKGWPLVVGGLVLGVTPLMSHAGEFTELMKQQPQPKGEQ